MLTYQVPNDEIKSAIAFLNAALAVDSIYDCTKDYSYHQQLRLANVDAAILQLSFAKKALETPPVHSHFKS